MPVYQTGIVLNLLLKLFHGSEAVQVTIFCTRHQVRPIPLTGSLLPSYIRRIFGYGGQSIHPE